MPHITIEYTRNIDGFSPRQALAVVNQTLLDSGHFQPPQIKSRAIALDDYLVGTDPQGQGFVHVQAAIMAGRSLQERQALSQQVLESLRELVQHIPRQIHVQLTVDVIEIQPDTYAKTALESAA
ncbi:5-carboxymethyl-2-hydroxymuconate Delta-isomerase [Lampropedia hyalina]|nr:5-carboxymethyl-2-hydroxymuconate Delta-isomerase [Lampropedia hyalina]